MSATRKLPIRLISASTANKIAKKSILLSDKQKRMVARKEMLENIRNEMTLIREKIIDRCLDEQFYISYEVPDGLSYLGSKRLIEEIDRRLSKAGYVVNRHGNATLEIGWGGK